MAEISRADATELRNHGNPVFLVLHFPPPKKIKTPDGSTTCSAPASEAYYFTDWYEAVDSARAAYFDIPGYSRSRHKVLVLLMPIPACPGGTILWANSRMLPNVGDYYRRGASFDDLIRAVKLAPVGKDDASAFFGN